MGRTGAGARELKFGETVRKELLDKLYGVVTAYSNLTPKEIKSQCFTAGKGRYCKLLPNGTCLFFSGLKSAGMT